jgi:hypothetical protein
VRSICFHPETVDCTCWVFLPQSETVVAVAGVVPTTGSTLLSSMKSLSSGGRMSSESVLSDVSGKSREREAKTSSDPPKRRRANTPARHRLLAPGVMGGGEPSLVSFPASSLLGMRILVSLLAFRLSLGSVVKIPNSVSNSYPRNLRWLRFWQDAFRVICLQRSLTSFFVYKKWMVLVLWLCMTPFHLVRGSAPPLLPVFTLRCWMHSVLTMFRWNGVIA